MVQRLSPRDREAPERARQRFDGQLSVRAWATPGTRPKPETKPRDPRAPWWWESAEDASQSFLTAMGVKLQ